MRVFLPSVCFVFLPFFALTQTSISWEAAMEVAPSEFGYTNLRMELNSDGDPVIVFGKSGNGVQLHCSRWNGLAFDAPVAVTNETNLFINDAEGPRMAISGQRVAVAYQLSGQWATGGRVVLSEDGGGTWGEPIPIAPNATEDHFMPVPAFDENQQPWVTVKWGSNPVREGAMFWDVSNSGFIAPVDAGAAMEGDAVCECCASMPFSHQGIHYNVVRNNNDNIRDFWTMKTDDTGDWNESLDIDPTNWNINSCPASEAETCVLDDGTMLAVFMSAADGGSRVHWSSVDIEDWSLLASDRIQPSTETVENHPSVHANSSHSVVAWESNQGGYDILVATGDGTATGPMQWSNSTASVTEDLSGHSRRPVVRVFQNTVHLVYQRPSEGTFHYRRGTIGQPSAVVASETTDPIHVTPTLEGWRTFQFPEGFSWTVHDLSGRHMASGHSPHGHIDFGLRGMFILGIRSGQKVQHLKLAR